MSQGSLLRRSIRLLELEDWGLVIVLLPHFTYNGVKAVKHDDL